MHTTRRILLTAAAGWGLLLVGAQAQVTTHTNAWTAGAGDGQWTNAANWALGVVPSNDASNHYVVVFGDLPADAPQNINLSSTHYITRIEMEATSDRNYTVSGSPFRFTDPSGWGQLRIDVTAAAGAGLTFQNTLQMDWIQHVFQNNSTQSLLTLNGLVTAATGHDRRLMLRGAGDILFNRQSGAAGNYRYLYLEDNLNLSTDTENQRIVGDGSGNYTLVQGTNINLSLISDLTFTDLATDGTYGLFFSQNSELKVRASGGDSATRVLTARGPLVYGGTATAGILRIVANETGTTGDFILRLAGNHDHEVPVETRAGSIVEITNTVAAALVQKAGTDPMVISGAGALRKTGAGILDIQTDQQYTGTTWVDEGTLRINGSLHADSAVQVAAGATLGGSGQAGNVVVAGGGILAPGNSIGTLTVNDLSLDEAAVLNFDLAAPGDPGDRVVVLGDLALGGTLNVDDAGGFDVGTYTLFEYSGTLYDQENLALGTLPAGYTYELDFDTNGEVNLQVIPEPAALTLLLGGLGALALRRRRTRRF